MDHVITHKEGDEIEPDDEGNCPEGMVLDSTQAQKVCKKADMESKAFSWGDNIDPYINDVADTTESLDTVQEAVNENTGINPIALEIVCGIFFILLMCACVPIYFMMTKRKFERYIIANYISDARPAAVAATELAQTDSSLEDHV